MADRKIPRPVETAYKQLGIETGLTGNTKESLEWFRKYVTKNLHRMDRTKAFQLGDATVNPKPGEMFVYGYDAKYKDTLPYWDKFPLIVCIWSDKTHFLGINLHYCPPKIRALIFEQLLDTVNNTRFNEKTKFKVNWEKLKQFAQLPFIKHAVKKYLKSHLVTPMYKIHPEHWQMAIFLPIAQFTGATQQKVWKDI